MLTKPARGKRSILSYRYLHTFLNNRPVEPPKTFKSIFYQLYLDFEINNKTIPIVVIHIESQL